MVKHFLEQWSMSLQARFGLWLNETFCDVHDVAQYDPHIQAFLSELGNEIQTYAPLPGFDYQNATQENWKFFIQIAGQWTLAQMPNPFYEVCASADSTVILEPIMALSSEFTARPHSI
jgi:hypothetical protein